MDKKFAANQVTGTGSMNEPIATSPQHSGFGPRLSPPYDSSSGNGPFGFGWSLSVPSLTRKTDKGLPQYRDTEKSDVLILSCAEDLVPVLQANRQRFEATAIAASCKERWQIEILPHCSNERNSAIGHVSTCLVKCSSSNANRLKPWHLI